NKAFEFALKKHLDQLGVKPELPWFQASDPQEIVDFIRGQQNTYRKTSKLHRSVDYWNSKIIEPLRQFFTAVDQGVSSHPEIGGIVWGCIRFIIETLSGHSRYFNKIVSVLELISRDLHSYHQYATLLYWDSDATTANLDSKVNIERQVREHNQHQGVNEDRERAQKKDERELLLEKVPYIECQAKHESCTAIFSGRPAPGQWFLLTESYQCWQTCAADANDLASHLLWVRGKFGIGKTVLASVIVKDLKSRENVNPNIAVAYFYCEHDQTSKMDPLNILGTIFYQLMSLLPADSLAMKILNDKRVLPATISDLKVLLHIVLGGLVRTYIVIDALDECPAVALQQLLPILVSLSRKASILVTTRPNAPLIQRAFEGRAQSIVMTARDVNPDIEQYIRQCIITVDEADPDRDFGPVIEVRDHSLRKEIVDMLIKNAEGMFLWVRLQVQHLAEQHTDHDIRASLQDLPRGLDATYIRSLDHIYHLDDKRRRRVQGVFRWLICAGSPGLDVELVRHAIAVEEMSDHWDPSMVVTNHNGLISDCANLV
ncbi:hypothetical protein EV421DRAFT_1680781, partial [Armillaria borealis]